MPDRPGGYEVGIVGAGILGSAIAYALAKRRIASVVLDESGVGGEAPDTISAPVRAHVDAPALTEDQVAAGSQVVERHAAMGLPVRWLSREEALRREPALSPAVLGAVYSPHDGSVNPFLLIRRLLSTSRRLGSGLVLYCRHFVVEPRGGGFLVRTARGETQVRRLVLASGHGVADVGRQLGVVLPLRRIRRLVLVTGKHPPLLRHVLARAWQQLTGEVVIESDAGDTGAGPGVSPEEMEQLARSAVATVPSVSEARVIRAIAGVRLLPAGRPLVVGRVEDGVYAAVAAHAVTLAPLVGDAIAELVANDRLPAGWETWDPGDPGSQPGDEDPAPVATRTPRAGTPGRPPGGPGGGGRGRQDSGSTP